MKIFRSATAITLLSFAVAFLSLLTLAGVRFVQAAWAPPTAAPPGGNVAAPINVSGTSQTKQGNLTIGGEYLSVSGGDLLFASDDRGVFWADSTDNTKPHIESAGGILYLSPGENAGSGTEIQGDLKISTLGVAAPNPGSLTIENSQNSRMLTFNLETGAVGADIKSINAPLFLNYDSNQKVQVGSNIAPAELCLNDDPGNPDPTKCISSWGGGGFWTLNQTTNPNTLHPIDTAYLAALNTITPYSNVAGVPATLTVKNRDSAGADMFGLAVVSSSSDQILWGVGESLNGNGVVWLFDGSGNTRVQFRANGESYINTPLAVNATDPDPYIMNVGGTVNASGIYYQNGVPGQTFVPACPGNNNVVGDITVSGGIVTGIACEADDVGGGGAYTAENGLTLNGNAFGLDGGLIRNTTITQANFSYTHNLNGSGDFLVQDNSVTRFEVRDDGGIYLSGVANCNGTSTLDTNANGQIVCGSDDSGGGGDSLWAGTEGVGVYPKTPASTRVAIGHSTFGDSTQLSVKNNSVNSTIYSEQQNAAGYAGYFSGKTVVMNGNVGIGIAGPNTNLHVYKAPAALGFDAGLWIQSNFGDGTVGRGGGVTFQNNDVYAGGIYAIRQEDNWKGALVFYTHNNANGNTFGTTFTEKMRIQDNGNVGIGTTTPTERLTFASASYIGLPSNGGVNVPVGWNRGNAGGIIFAGSANPDGSGWAYGSRLINHDYGDGLALSYDVLNGGVWTNDALVIGGRNGNIGNVGIGTNNPQAKLDVANGIRVFNTNNPYLYLRKTSGTARDAYMEIINDNLSLTYTGVQRLVIDPSGNVKIPYLANCNGANTVDADANGNLVCGADMGGGAGDNLGNHIATQNIQLNNNWLSNDGGNEGFRIDNGGNVGIGTSTIDATLDVAGYMQAKYNSNEGPSLTLKNTGKTANNEGLRWTLYNMKAAYGAGLQFWVYDTAGCGSGLCASRVTFLDNGRVGIGTSAPNELLEINGNIRGNQNGAIRVQTTTGYLDLGSQNASYAHLFTDRPRFYFNHRIVVDGGVSSYSNNDLVLETGETARITVRGNGAGGDAGKVGIANSVPSALLTVASDAAPYSANHAFAAYNNSATNYNGVAGYKSGSNVAGSGVYGELKDSMTCSGTCAGVYGSEANGGTNKWSGYFDGRVNVSGNLTLQGRTKPLSIKVCQIGTDTCPGRYLYTSGTAVNDMRYYYWNAIDKTIVSVLVFALNQCPSGYSLVAANTSGRTYFTGAGCAGDETIKVASNTPYRNPAVNVCRRDACLPKETTNSYRTNSGCYNAPNEYGCFHEIFTAGTNQIYELR